MRANLADGVIGFHDFVRMTGVSVAVARNMIYRSKFTPWDDSTLGRTRGGNRIYDQKHVDAFMKMRQLMEFGLHAEIAANAVRQEIADDLIQRLSDLAPQQEVAA